MLEVLFDDFDGSFAQGDHPLFATFAFGQAVAFIERDVCQEQVGDFRDTAACGVEEFEDSAITLPVGIVLLGGGKELFDYGGWDDFRDSSPDFRSGEQLGGILGDPGFELQELVEHSQGDDVACDACGCQVLFF